MTIIDELQLSKDLIRFPSITPIDAGAISFLSKKLKKLGFNCKILEFKDKGSAPIKNLYARIGKKGPNLCYAGHTDVVPPGNIKDWTVNPFKPKIKKNNPHIIIFDEPLVALDMLTKKKIIKLILDFSQQKTLVIITHGTDIIPYVNRVIDFNKLKR